MSAPQNPIAADLGPLVWVQDEVRKSLELASKAVKRYVREAEQTRSLDLTGLDAAPLRIARQQVHQAVGALEMVGQDACARLLGAMERLVDHLLAQPQACNAQAAEAFEQAHFALVEFLEARTRGRGDSSVGLFVQYQALAACMGDARIHPIDLWEQTFEWRAVELPAAPALAYDAPEAARLDALTLQWVKTGQAAAAQALHTLALGFAQAQTDATQRALWALAAAYYQAGALGLLTDDVYAKRVASRVLMHYRALRKGSAPEASILGRELLFACAGAERNGVARAPSLAAVLTAWDLLEQPALCHDRARYGQVDPALLAQARKHIVATAETWSALCGGDLTRGRLAQELFVQVTDALLKLQPSARALAVALQDALASVLRAGQPPSGSLGLEVATAVLYLESAFEDFDPLASAAQARADALALRVQGALHGQPQPPLQGWMEELYRRVSDRQSMGSVVQELRSAQNALEAQLDAYFRASDDLSLLHELPGQLAQMRGVFSVLGLDQAASAVARLRANIEDLLIGAVPTQRQAALFDSMGNSLGALRFLIDMLSYQRELAKQLFDFDESSGELRAVVLRSPDVSAPASNQPETPVQIAQVAPDFEAIRPISAPILTPPLAAPPPVAAPVAAAPSAPSLPPAASPETPDEDDDAELRDIFIDEAREVAQTAQATLAGLRSQPGDPDQLTALRRAFHTLKGSSRMVGLTEFGEAAWALEQVFNAWLPSQQPASPALLDLAAQALAGFAAWINAVAQGGDAALRAAPYREAADALRLHQRAQPLRWQPQDATPNLPETPVQRAQTAPEFEASDGADASPSETVPAAPAVQTATASDLSAQAESEPTSGFAPTAFAADGPDGLDFSATQLLPPEADAGESGFAATQMLPPTAPPPASANFDLGLDFDLVAAAPTPEPPVEPVAAPLAQATAEPVAAPPAEREAQRLAEPAPVSVPDAPAPRLDGVSVQAADSALDGLDFDALFGEQNQPESPVPLAQTATNSEAIEKSEPAAPGADLAAPPAREIDLADLDLPSLDLPSLDTPEPSTTPDEIAPDKTLAQAALDLDLTPPDQPLPDVELPTVLGIAPSDADAYRHIGALRVPVALYNVFLNEADEWSRRLAVELSEWALLPQAQLGDHLVAMAHSLAGSSATVGHSDLSQLARALENALAHLQRGAVRDAAGDALLVEAAEQIRALLHQFAAGFLKSPDAALLEGLHALLARELPPIESAPDSVFGEDWPMPPLSVPADPTPEPAAEPSPEPALAVAPTLEARSAPAPESFAGGGVPAPAPVVPSAQALGAPDLEPGVALADVPDVDLFAIFDEEAAELLPQLGAQLRRWAQQPALGGAREPVLRVLHTFKGSARLAGLMRLGERAHRLESAAEVLHPPAPREAVEHLLAGYDALVAHLDALRAQPLQAMALPEGLSATLGQARIDPALVGEAAASESTPAPAAPAQAAVAQPNAVPQTDATTAVAPPAVAAWADAASASTAAPRAPAGRTLRVKTALLERMTNQAAEVMTSRARLQLRADQLSGGLADLTGNLDRLRAQLRELEVQAEGQMQSRLAQARESAQGFDPLEFDRFTRVQELTRMLAESVHDVATLQRGLQQSLAGVEDELSAQARQTRELQRDLLRTRMIEFNAVAERLHGVVRQAAKDAGKSAQLEITGGAIEIDRSVLERMTASFEHLLRNAVAHGVEPDAQRLAAGKPVPATLRLQLEPLGSDVRLTLRDDGAGLDLPRIRARAVAQGWLQADQSVDDAHLAQLIFQSGLSTAEQVTELAGRGVGMDVVRNEVNALGGQVQVASTAGQGTTFTLVLPLTTAVSAIVLLRLGEQVVGVPAHSVELVRRISPAELANAQATQRLDYAGESLDFYWLGALLQASPASTEPVGKAAAVLIARSAGQRVAVQIDEVLGNQEVVVKNLGPQLARLPGLAGMSLLPSGAVVLIYNPVALAASYGARARVWAAEQLVLAAQTSSALPAAQQSAQAQAQAQAPLVLVVDDSITVRRVTQRLLKREGYRVALAGDGLQALERLQEERPAVVLSDIEMPRMDGFDLVRNIRADAALAGLPVVLITSRIAQKHRDYAQQLSVDHYLGKPYPEEELLALVRGYAEQARGAAADLTTA